MAVCPLAYSSDPGGTVPGPELELAVGVVALVAAEHRMQTHTSMSRREMRGAKVRREKLRLVVL